MQEIRVREVMTGVACKGDGGGKLIMIKRRQTENEDE